MTYLIGIDGGGTGCRALLCTSAGEVRGRGAGGSANILTNFDGAYASIVEASQMACREAGLPDSVLSESCAYLGLAGANIGEYAEKIAGRLPFAKCRISTDAFISLQGAIGDDDGTVAIIGTGSVFISRTGTASKVVGGWGFIVGDQGSGARIGRDLLEEALLAHDQVRPATALTTEIIETFAGDPRAVVEFAQSARPGQFAGFAPMVFRHVVDRDPAALRIVSKSVTDIEETLASLLPVGNDQPHRLCMLGGLGGIYGNLLSGKYRELIHEPLGDAADGAVALAVKAFGDGVTDA